VPVPPEVIESHASLEVAVQPQEDPFVEIVKELVPPEALNAADAELNPVTAHAAAVCVTVWVCPPAVIVAERVDAFGFADAEYAIVPLDPVPVAPEVITSHAALDSAVQPQVEPFVVTATLPLPPAAAIVAVAGESAVTAHAAADCVTAWVCPPAVIVALRSLAFGFAETLYSIVPELPVPEAPEVIESHAALELALQPHDAPFVEIVKEFVPPEALKDAVAELNPVTAHAAADCVTVWVCPPAVIVAERSEAFGFAATEYAIVPLAPVPVAPEVIESHAALDSAVHGQDAPFVVIVTLPVPPVALKDAVAGVSPLTTHAAADCVTVWVWPPAVIVAEREAAFGFAEAL